MDTDIVEYSDFIHIGNLTICDHMDRAGAARHYAN